MNYTQKKLLKATQEALKRAHVPGAGGAFATSRSGNVNWKAVLHEVPSTLTYGQLSWALLMVGDPVVQKWVRKLLSSRLAVLLYDPYSRKRASATAVLDAGRGSVGMLRAEAGPHP